MQPEFGQRTVKVGIVTGLPVGYPVRVTVIKKSGVVEVFCHDCYPPRGRESFNFTTLVRVCQSPEKYAAFFLLRRALAPEIAQFNDERY